MYVCCLLEYEADTNPWLSSYNMHRGRIRGGYNEALLFVLCEPYKDTYKEDEGTYKDKYEGTYKDTYTRLASILCETCKDIYKEAYEGTYKDIYEDTYKDT
jgi:hypothetical protein